MQSIGRRIVLAGALGLCFLAIGLGMAKHYQPGLGFTRFICVGSKNEAKATAAFKAIPHYVLPNSDGYDGTFYVQIALNPTLGDPQLPGAIDNLHYRARRILFSWTAWLGGLGQPAWIVQAYALQNVVFWLANGILLWYWLPPNCWFNVLRWAGIQLSAGWTSSIGLALLDGPALFLLLLSVWANERGHPRWAAGILGISALGRETNLLAGLILLPSKSSPSQGWGDLFVRLILAVAPLALWSGCLYLLLGSSPPDGGRNFASPFSALAIKFQELRTDFPRLGHTVVYWGTLLAFLSIGPQLAYFLSRFDWDSPWWRIGFAFSILGLCLGTPVWEDYPGAFGRVLLPLTAAFNLSLKPGREGYVFLVLGNMGWVQGLDALRLKSIFGLP